MLTALVALALLAPAIPAGAQAGPTITHGYVGSFDGTPIAYTLFMPEGASGVPVVFNTHGWGGTRTRTATGMVATLLSEGYAVITWDARGFGDSGGEANSDSPAYEGRDVQALIDFVASRDGILLDGDEDPRMGMIGGSYAGGIQLMTASIDQRVDAIVPQIPWNDLPQSLKPGGIFKLGWDLLLYGAGLAAALGDGIDAPGGPQTGAYAPQIHQSLVEGVALNDWSPESLAWFDARSPKHYINGGTVENLGHVDGIHAPMLIQQGLSDTLFPLNEGLANMTQVAANGVEAKMVAFCGGHAANLSCSTTGAGAFQTATALAWFTEHLKGGAAYPYADISYQLQDGTFAGTSASALGAGTLFGSGTATLVNQIVPTSGAAIAATAAPDGTRIPIYTATSATTLLGIPSATVSVSGVGLEAYLFFKLLDVDADGDATVIDDQVSARKVTGLGGVQTFYMDLAGVAWKLATGHSLALEVSSTSNTHASSRLPFVANVEVGVEVPVL